MENTKQANWIRDDILNDKIKDPIKTPEGIEEKNDE